MDLIQPNAKDKTRDTRFLKRVFLPDEEKFIQADCEPNAMLWALWTGKEAAYKSIQKDSSDIPSIPRLYKVTIDRCRHEGPALRPGERTFTGTVETPKGNLNLETLITPEYVHSIAVSSPPPLRKRVAWQIQRMPITEQSLPEFESLYVRHAVKRRLARYWQSGLSDIDIRRFQGPRGLGPPCVFFKGKHAAIDISLSHDGQFAAYAFTILPSLLPIPVLEII
ncbi:MAG: 4'-phosphopantetheinyl transferase superfamily protein [Syntrophales bacterium LBB04]|nr:4'-phosphopantetheinyl transferase superfamily protein [Syntrophales bacterium LBB04]